MLKIWLETVRTVMQQTAKKGLLVLMLFLLTFTFGGVIWFLYDTGERKAERYEARIDKAEMEVHACHLARIADAAVFREQLAGLKATVRDLQMAVSKKK
jgi:cbb3-type cytochrome oxidase subunit 3